MIFPKIVLTNFNFTGNKYFGRGDNCLTISIPTIKFKSGVGWRRTRKTFVLHSNAPVILLETAYRGYHILPLMAICEGIIPKNALRWKYCRAYYPILNADNLINLDGSPIEEELKANLSWTVAPTVSKYF